MSRYHIMRGEESPEELKESIDHNLVCSICGKINCNHTCSTDSNPPPNESASIEGDQRPRVLEGVQRPEGYRPPLPNDHTSFGYNTIFSEDFIVDGRAVLRDASISEDLTVGGRAVLRDVVILGEITRTTTNLNDTAGDKLINRAELRVSFNELENTNKEYVERRMEVLNKLYMNLSIGFCLILAVLSSLYFVLKYG